MESAMAEPITKDTFLSMYQGQAPWDIDRPQQAFVEIAHQVTGSVLDAGCGTGENALFFASRGRKVTGIDFVEEAIRRANEKAVKRGVTVAFVVKDALTLGDWNERFDSVIDSGLFHVFTDEDRMRYVAGLAHVVKKGGRLFLMCFSDEEPGMQGPRRISQKELRDAFAKVWTIESLAPARFHVNPSIKDFTFSEGGPKAWFAVVRRESD